MKTNRKAPVRPNPGKRTPVKLKRSAPPPETAGHPMAGLLERISDGFVAFDAQLNYTYVNARGGEMLGRQPADLIGKNYWKEYPEAKGTPFANAYLRALKEQTPLQIENYYEPFDRWFENRIYPSPDGLTIFFQDITERKRSEQALHDNEERLARIVETVPEGIAIINRTGQITFANAAAERILGLTRSDIAGRTFNDPGWRITTVDGSPFPEAELPFVQVMRSGQPVYGIEHAIEHPDGQRVVLSINAAPLREADGAMNGVVTVVSDITERKRMEEAVLKERDFTNAALESLPGIVYLYDHSGKFLRWNKNFEIVSGYSAEEIASMHPLDYFVGEEKEHLARRIQEVFEKGTSDAEAHFTSKTGVQTPYYFTGKRVELAGLPCLIGMGIDITERQQMENELRESERRFREVLANLQLIAIMLDTEGRVTFCNDYLLRLTSWDRDEVLGQDWFAVFVPGKWGEVRKTFVTALSSGNLSAHYEDPILTKTGQQRDILWSNTLLRNVEGHVIGTASIGEDITDRKQAEEALQAHRQLLETVVNHIPASVSLLRGSDLRVQLINPAYQAIAPGKEMLGKTWDELWAETGQNFAAICRQVLETGEPHHVVDELNMIRRTSNGPIEPAYFSWSLNRVRLPGNEGWGLLGTAWETTDRKRAEEELRRLNLELEQRVAERTAEMKEQYVRAATLEERQRLARDLHDVVSQTLFSASVIAETLPRLWERNPTQVRDGLSELHRLTRGALSEMRTLLLELRPEAIAQANLADLLGQLGNALTGRAQLDVSVIIEPIPMLAPEVRLGLYRIAQEALNNVVKHARARRVEIFLTPLAEAARVQLRLRDDGHGFDAARLSPGRLGLGIMRERAEAIGAALAIHSAPDKGTEVVVTWPGNNG